MRKGRRPSPKEEDLRKKRTKRAVWWYRGTGREGQNCFVEAAVAYGPWEVIKKGGNENGRLVGRRDILVGGAVGGENL